jgi:hypothetical protein
MSLPPIIYLEIMRTVLTLHMIEQSIRLATLGKQWKKWSFQAGAQRLTIQC